MPPKKIIKTKLKNKKPPSIKKTMLIKKEEEETEEEQENEQSSGDNNTNNEKSKISHKPDPKQKEEEEEENEEDKKAPIQDNTNAKKATDSDSDLDPMLDLDVNAPPEYLCPITMSIMKDPVIMPDGQTYERKAIQKALNANPISPVTREPMSFEQAKTNYALKSLIEKYINEHGSEIKDEPTVIDPSKIVQEVPTMTTEIPYTELNEIKLETFSVVYTSDSMLVTVKPEQVKGRLPVSIVAVIDISASMDNDATIYSENSGENDQISRIQLVQYSLKTIISTLDSQDLITLITFNDKATVVASSIQLTIEGKEKVNNIIDNIRTRGCTNLWDGIDKAITHVAKQQTKKMNTSIMVFTDGEPNIHPPMGLIKTLEEKLANINVYFSISTFGYGYDIDANLMENIAEIGNGVYGYCPDASMVGTIFINYISSLISEISPLNNLTINGKNYKMVLYNGASSNLLIKLNENDQPENFQINLNSLLTNQTFLVNSIKKLDENDQNDFNIFRDQKYRKSLIDLILNVKDSMPIDELRNEVLKLFDQLKNEKDRSQFMKYLMMDLYNDDEQHGDIERACRDKNNFKKWGKNYLFSMLRFHILEQCGNFRDMSLQLYGNEIFIAFRKFGSKVFMNLPIPQRKSSPKRFGYPKKYRRPMPKKCANRKIRTKMARPYIKYDDDDDDDEEESEEEVRPKKIIKKPPQQKPTIHRNCDNDDDDDEEESEEEVRPKKIIKKPLQQKPKIHRNCDNDDDDDDEESEEEARPKKVPQPKQAIHRNRDEDEDEDESDKPKFLSYKRKRTMRSYFSKKKKY